MNKARLYSGWEKPDGTFNVYFFIHHVFAKYWEPGCRHSTGKEGMDTSLEESTWEQKCQLSHNALKNTNMGSATKEIEPAGAGVWGELRGCGRGCDLK